MCGVVARLAVASALRVNSDAAARWCVVAECAGAHSSTVACGGIGTRGVQQDGGVQLHGGLQGCAGCALAHKVCKSRRCVTALT